MAFAEHLEQVLGWDSVYAWNRETFGPVGTLGPADTPEAVLTRDLRATLLRLNAKLPKEATCSHRRCGADGDEIRPATKYQDARLIAGWLLHGALGEQLADQAHVQRALAGQRQPIEVVEQTQQ